MRKLRLSFGMTQKTFATKLGINERSVEKFEKDHFRIPEGIAKLVFTIAPPPIPYEKRWMVLSKEEVKGLHEWTPRKEGWTVNVTKKDAERVAKLLPNRSVVAIHARYLIERLPERELWKEVKLGG